MKDHEIAHIHNQLKKAAIECHSNGSLRASLAHVVSPLVSEVRRLQAEVERLRRGLSAVRVLMDESYGVAGLHLDGELAEWGSLEAGGHFEGWLIDFNEAEETARKQGEQSIPPSNPCNREVWHGPCQYTKPALILCLSLSC